MNKFIPAFDWIRNYNKTDLTGDLQAGLIVAIMLIPQGMAYAMLAGLPPVIGLYASTVPLIIYALFGTSRQLAVGPVAMVSLLVLAGVSTIAEPGSKEYISLVLLLALMIGVIQFLMGLFKLGFIVNFLSHGVISAFTSAAAIIIGLSQLKELLGIKIESSNVFGKLWEVINKFTEIHVTTFVVGIISILLLVGLKKFLPKVPAPLVVVVLSTLSVYFLNLEEKGVKIVGSVPQGLPSLSFPSFDMNALVALLPIALTISFVGFMESIAMAKAIAAKEKYKVDANKELIGLGLANVGGSFFSAYPVTGGFSRSAVNYQAGARTPLASVITAVLIILTLLFFTPLFYYLPKAVLAAIIMVAVYGLIDFNESKELFKIQKTDGFTWLITFLATLTLGIEQGILIGAAFSLIIFIWRSANPHVAELGLLETESVYKNINRYPNAKIDPEVLIFRVDSSLYFANMTFLEDKLCDAASKKERLKWIILDFSGVNSIDAVAIHSFEDLIANCSKGEVKFLAAGMKGPVLDLFKKSEIKEKLGNRFKYHYLTIDHALKDIGK
ncbi:solute carrier family 26 protein [Bacillus aquiflavi]|uniref:Solute carrier 26 family protein n=1 Tax=Bacillus aquiflavi TaxID=2672567 RepID=A0A6B3VTP5_9BACI|nr:solute carrier family 26 protein [Bacillus aquiflavi]MBA4535957.1 solute carrier family 26 protein [Bacillus aquiflavi]NEY80332.1 solute carrier 26 family protein [Bacillus aquiflavi]